MMSGKDWIKLVKENRVLLVCVPLIIGIHWGWWKMQQNPKLVKPEDRSELPIYTMYKMARDRLMGQHLIEATNKEEKELIKD